MTLQRLLLKFLFLRKMHIATSIICFALISLNAEEGQKKFHLDADAKKLLWNIGDSYPGQEVPIYFDVTSKDGKKFQITKIEKSCSCVDIELNRKSNPSEGRIMFKAGNLLREVGADVVFFWSTKSGKERTTLVSIRSVIRKAVILQPERLSLKTDAAVESNALEGKVLIGPGNMGYEWDEINASSSDSALSFQPKALEEGKWELNVHVDPAKSNAGVVSSEVEVTLKKGGNALSLRPQFTVEYSVKSRFVSEPEILFVHDGENVKTGDLSLTIRGKADDAIKLLEKPVVHGEQLKLKDARNDGKVVALTFERKKDSKGEHGSSV